MKYLFLTILGIIAFLSANAQHDHSKHNQPAKKDTVQKKEAPAAPHKGHTPPKSQTPPDPHKGHTPAKTPAPADTTKKQEHDHHHHHTGMLMSHAYSLSLPMNRNGSGTAWQPDNTPMYAYMWHPSDRWMVMIHGNLFLRYNWQNLNNPGKRGGQGFDAPNWVMGMFQRKMGENGLLTFTPMISFDRFTMGGNGYPLLFQSGETWEDEPLVDRQHPHDLLSALSVGYTHRINDDIDATLYVGYPGEPAIGPTAFMHRISALSNPDAPLGHHWQDATHIVFGVGTAGIRYKWLKLEGSIFTGREPDENRFNFDRPRFDSYSYRLSANPAKSLSLQFSQAWIKSPESVSPETNVFRTTASAIHSFWPGENTSVNSALVWGLNNAGHGHIEHSLLAESGIASRKNFGYLRYEWIQKSAHELALDEELGHDAIEPVHAVTLGYSRTLFSYLSTDLALGAQGSVFLPSEALGAFYGNQPLSAEVYLRITPGMMVMRGR